jgi:AmmeMemoRadiSam system protein B
MRVRRPSFAGSFYPVQSNPLNKLIQDSFLHKLGPGRLPRPPSKKRNILSVICPHAGYIYSGPCAAYSYLNLAEQKKPETIIIVGPNHTGWGSPISMMGEGSWETPFGQVPINEELAREIFNRSDLLDMNETAHIREHSIEVQLPFLQFIYDEFKFIPISMGLQDLESCISVGQTLAHVSKDKDMIIIASSDLTHQEPQESANKRDRIILDTIEEMDEKKLQEEVYANRISMCGYGPVSVALVASKLLGAKRSVLLSYYTSGDIIGDHSSVVGYAAAKITK